MTALIISLLIGYGVHLVFTDIVLGWTGSRGRSLGAGVDRSGRDKVRASIPAGLTTGVAMTGLALGFAVGALVFAVFGGLFPAGAAFAFAAWAPLASQRSRIEKTDALARDAWPRLIDEIRLLTGSMGRSIPQALFDVGRRAPAPLRPAFATAEREWLLSTDFSVTVASLKQALGDATADAALETLLVAHRVGGSDLDKRLASLAEDRVQDLQGRKDARAKQAGVRFARRFVLIVPAGMALAGLSIGTGRTAYQSPIGQTAVVFGIAVIVACWIWAGRLMRLPTEERVFST